MSWSFDFVADNKVAALQEIDSQAQLPDSFRAIIRESINDQQDGQAIHVKSNGHIGGQWGNNGHFEVRPIQLVSSKVEETPTA